MDEAGLRRVQWLSAPRRRLLIRTLGAPEAASPTRRPDDAPTSLAPVQRRLWFEWRLQPEGLAYNNPWAAHLSGPLDRAALASALDALVARHEVLRARIEEVEGEPVLRFDPARPGTLVVEACEAGALSARIDEEVRRPFDLARGPLFRARLWVLGPEVHVLLLDAHHIATDAWSYRVLQADLAELYARCRAGLPVQPLPSSAPRFRDWVAWRAQRERPVDRARWSSILDDPPGPLVWTGAGERGAPPTALGLLRARVDLETTARLRLFAQRRRATLFAVLLGGLARVLSEISGQNDLLILAPVVDRQWPGGAALVGPMIELSVLRLRPPPGAAPDALVAEAWRALTEAMASQAPFEALVAWFPVLRGVGVSLVFDDAPVGEPTLEGLAVERLQTPATGAKLDLILSVIRREEGLDLIVEHRLATLGAPAAEELLDRLVASLAWMTGEPDTAPALERATNLTRSQHLVWLGQELAPDSPVYSSIMAFDIVGALDHPRLDAAIQTVVDGADALRATYGSRDGVPVRVVAPALRVSTALVDLSDAEDPRALAAAWEEADRRRPHDPSRGVLRSSLLRLAPDRHTLVLNLHHIATDAWSTALLFRRASAAYLGQTLPPSPGFEDYARAERAHRLSPAGRAADAWWAERRVPVPAPSWYGARAADAGYTMARLERPLGAARAEALAALARERGFAALSEHLARFGLVAAVVVAWMAAATGQRRVSLGTPTHGRAGPRDREVIGFCMEAWPLRVQVAPSDSFRALARRVREEHRAALAHLPCATPTRTGHRAYHALLNYHIAEYGSFAGLPTHTRWIHPGPGLEDVGVQLHDFDGEGRPVLGLDLRREIFDDALGERAMAELLACLDRCLEDPDQPAFPLRAAVATGPRPLPVDLAEGFAAACARAPQAPAVVRGSERTSYAALDARAAGFAAALQARGVRRGDVVAVLLPVSVELVAAVLALTRIGAAWLPIADDNPCARVAALVAEGQARLIITRRGAVELPIPRIEVEDTGSWEGPAPAVGPRAPDGPVYVITTSGSTGHPKAVAVLRRAFEALVAWYREVARFGADSRALIVSAPGFDLTQKNWFAPLLAGGQLHLPAEAGWDPAALAATIEEHRITHINCTPSVFRALVEQGGLGSLRVAVLGGEALPTAPLRAWAAGEGRGCTILNSYGPAECTDVVASHLVDPLTEDPAPLGAALPGVALLVLDEALQPVEGEAPGELYIGGDVVSLGYLGRTRLTAERFLPSPLGDGGRIYRTGDRVRRRADGLLEFLGRCDDQVKIRGQRVEPGDVEAALLRVPGVLGAAVAARGDPPELVAWVVPTPEGGPDRRTIRQRLAEQLPSAMLPAAIVRLHALPLSPNGKVARGQLPAPSAADRQFLEGLGRPVGLVEETVAAHWADALGVDPASVGRDDDFFASGGHSLLATRLLARLTEAFGVALRLRTLFDAPTVRGIAAAITSGRRATPLVPPALPEGPVPLSPTQLAVWLRERFHGGIAPANLCVAVRMRGAVDPSGAGAALELVRDRHPSLRTRIFQEGAAVFQQILPPGGRARTRRDAPCTVAEAAERVAQERRAPLAVGEGETSALRVIPLLDGDTVLCLTLSHLVADGWSMGIVTRELIEAWDGLRAGLTLDRTPRPPWFIREATAAGPTPPRPTALAPRALGLPPPPTPGPPDAPAVRAPLWIPAEPVARLGRRAAAEGTTLFSALLGLTALAIARAGGTRSLVLGADFARRDDPELALAVGLFARTLPLELPLRPALGFGAWLREIRARVLDAWEQDAPPAGPGGAGLARLVLQDFADRPPVLEGAEPFVEAPGAPATDLLVFARRGADGIRGGVEIDPARLDPGLASHIAADLSTLAALVATSPDQPVEALLPAAAPAAHPLLRARRREATDGP